jgi:Fe2+ transport system protein B
MAVNNNTNIKKNIESVDSSMVRRGLQDSRIKQQQKQQYLNEIANDIEGSRANIYKAHKQGPKTDNTKKQNLRKLQKVVQSPQEEDSDEIKIRQNKINKKFALALLLAILKDTAGDATVVGGYLIDIYFFIFFFGKGASAFLKKDKWPITIAFIIGLIPVLSALVPETIFAVIVRWFTAHRSNKKKVKINEG